MEHMNDVSGPKKVVLKNGEEHDVDFDDGGGSMISGPDAGVYEVFFMWGKETKVFDQKDIEEVLDVNGNRVMFGNPYFADHPYSEPHSGGSCGFEG